ncbi:hypothetical protein [Clostridium botulinum]|uniref:hypothetical protein n=1 Tax=Clostridium botulinum TaxID=1491 RepID=UPI0004D7BCAE|nr:hypothetical protein [Clostridium botulinum]KEI04290.1 hypothetical protein Z953_02970 [Clostridium botulinum D str. 16868]
MDIGLLEKEVLTNGLNATSKKYKLKKDKIKKLLGNKVENDKKNIIEKNNTTNDIKKNTLKNNIKDNILDNDIIKDITNNNIDIDKLRMLIENTEEILRIVEKYKLHRIKITNDKATVTTLRINEEVYGLVKEYSKKNNETITNIINFALIEYLESH